VKIIIVRTEPPPFYKIVEAVKAIERIASLTSYDVDPKRCRCCKCNEFHR
jgi:hypothetical protein